MNDAFWTLHSGLDREGPGEAADVVWAAATAGVAADARICDVASGPGADIAALLEVAPQGHVTALDKHRGFVDDVLGRYGDHPRVTAYKGDMAKLKGPFDFIWCAGAAYFLGVRKALLAWRPALARGGAIAFSHPTIFTDTPSGAVEVFWAPHRVKSQPEIAEAIARAGYVTLGQRRISDAAWENYYTPLEARIAALRPGADATLTAVLDVAATEAATWRAVKDETGYILSVVRPA